MRHHGHYGDNDVVIYCDTSFSLSPSFSVCLWDFLPIFASLISLKSANTPLNKKTHDLRYNSCPHHNQTSEVWAIVVAILVRASQKHFFSSQYLPCSPLPPLCYRLDTHLLPSSLSCCLQYTIQREINPAAGDMDTDVWKHSHRSQCKHIDQIVVI